MEYRFTTQVRSLATGKTYTAGQTVPADYTITEEALSQGVIVRIDAEPIIEEAPQDYEGMTVIELYDLLGERDLKVSGSKSEKISRLIADDKGGNYD